MDKAQEYTDKSKRLFIAIWPHEAVRRALIAAQADLSPLIAHPKPSSKRNLHLTLAFLGECTALQETAAKRAMARCAQSTLPFELKLASLGCFEKHHGGAIVWRGLDGDLDSLHALHARLCTELVAEGLGDFQSSSFGVYIPHISLFRGARLSQNSKAAGLAEALAAQAQKHDSDIRWAAQWQASSLSLVWSHRESKDGPLLYDEIAHAEFSAKESPLLSRDINATKLTHSRTIFIDADACPVIRETLSCARKQGIPVVIAGNTTQNLERHIQTDDPRSPKEAKNGFWVEVLDVSIGADSADFAIVEQLRPKDLVVTQDIGLAGMVLGRGARAIGVRGYIYRKETIDFDLMLRHEEKKVRRTGGRTKGPAPFTSEDRKRFVAKLRYLLTQN